MNINILNEKIQEFGHKLRCLVIEEIELYYYGNTLDEYKSVSLSFTKVNKLWNEFISENELDLGQQFYANIELSYFFVLYLAHEYTPDIIMLQSDIDCEMEKKRIREFSEGNASCRNDEIIKNFFKDEIFNIKTEIQKQNLKQQLPNELSWSKEQGAKTDLAELIYVLAESKKILKNDKPISKKDLTKVLNHLLGTDIDENKPTDLIGKRNLKESYIDELAKIFYDREKK